MYWKNSRFCYNEFIINIFLQKLKGGKFIKKVVICLIVILIIAILGVGGWFLFDNLQKEKSRTNELESKVTAMESKNENNNSNEENENKSNSNESKNEKSKENSTQTYDSLKGTYESQKINMNEGTNSEPVYMNYTIVLSKEGTFSAYYKCGDTDAHYVGYYTINENQVTMNSVVLVGNDPSASLCNEVLKFNLNSDGSFSDSENNKFTKTSSTPKEDTNIAKVIDSYMAGCSTSGKDGQGPWFYGLNK